LLGHVKVANFEEGIKVNHVHGHGVSLLEDLRTNVDSKGVQGPAAEDHDSGGAVVHKEQGHGGAGTD
jgi:hypothetical protein